jgi:hypothetical protein
MAVVKGGLPSLHGRCSTTTSCSGHRTRRGAWINQVGIPHSGGGPDCSFLSSGRSPFISRRPCFHRALGKSGARPVRVPFASPTISLLYGGQVTHKLCCTVEKAWNPQITEILQIKKRGGFFCLSP